MSIQYSSNSSSSTNILYLIILYTNSGCGKNIWTPPWTPTYLDAAVDIGSNPVSKHQIQPECGE